MSDANMTPEMPANFAQQLIRPKGIGNGKPNYSVTLALPKEDPFWEELRGQIDDAQREKFKKVLPEKKIRHYPIKDSDDVDWLKVASGLQAQAEALYGLVENDDAWKITEGPLIGPEPEPEPTT